MPLTVPCEACVQLIKAAIIAALGPVALASEFVEPVEDILDLLADELDLPVSWLQGALARISKMGIDNIAFEICLKKGLCRTGASAF